MKHQSAGAITQTGMQHRTNIISVAPGAGWNRVCFANGVAELGRLCDKLAVRIYNMFVIVPRENNEKYTENR